MYMSRRHHQTRSTRTHLPGFHVRAAYEDALQRKYWDPKNVRSYFAAKLKMAHGREMREYGKLTKHAKTLSPMPQSEFSKLINQYGHALQIELKKGTALTDLPRWQGLSKFGDPRTPTPPTPRHGSPTRMKTRSQTKSKSRSKSKSKTRSMSPRKFSESTRKILKKYRERGSKSKSKTHSMSPRKFSESTRKILKKYRER